MSKKEENVKEEKVIEVLKRFRILCQPKNYVVQRLHRVDPRRAPNFKEGDDAEIKYVWQDDGYFGITTSGLKSALKHILAHESVRRLKGTVNIKEYLKIIEEVSNELSGLVDNVIGREFGED